MINKKIMLLKVCLLICCIVSGGPLLVSAANVKIDFNAGTIINPQSFLSNIFPIHFVDNENDFWWFIYLTNFADWLFKVATKENDPNPLECRTQLWWFYYNSERWERLWPLDERTAESWYGDDVVVEWWIYTACVKPWYDAALAGCTNDEEESGDGEIDYDECIKDVEDEYWDMNSYYWSVTHDYLGKEYDLVLWVQYQIWDRWATIKSDGDLVPSLQRVENKSWDNSSLVWLVYDFNWWLWFAGCEFTWNKTSSLYNIISKTNEWTKISEMFEYSWVVEDGEIVDYELVLTGWISGLTCTWVGSFSDSWLTIIEGIVWINRWEQLDFLWMWKWWKAWSEKMQYFSSANIDNATLINYTRQKSESLCRGKWTLINDSSQIMQMLPISTGSVVCLSPKNDVEVSALNFIWSTLVVKWGNVIVEPISDAWDIYDDSKYYDIFVDSWSLLIRENDDAKFVFQYNWFVNENLSKDNFQSNVGAAYSDWIYAWEDVAVASLLKGNFIVNGSVRSENGDSLKNKYFVYWKFTTKDSSAELTSNFGWRCESGIWSDSYYCPDSSSPYEHPYASASLVIIDQNYDSPLFR